MSKTQTMKAVHYEGPFKVSVKEVPLPKIVHPDDAIIKVTTAGMLYPAIVSFECVQHMEQLHVPSFLRPCSYGTKYNIFAD